MKQTASRLPVVILGAGGHGRVVLDSLRSTRCQVVAFLDQDPSLKGKKVAGIPVLGGNESIGKTIDGREVAYVVGVGDNSARGQLIQILEDKRLPIERGIHSSAIVADDVEVADGVLVMAGAVVNTGSRLGKGVIVNTNASLDHDNLVEEMAQIMPGAILAGSVSVARYATIGTGAVVLPGIQIGENAYVGAGAVVRHDVKPNTTVVGVPAKFLKKRRALPS